MSFTGFSEEDLLRLKSADSGTNNEADHTTTEIKTTNIRKLDKIGARPKKRPQQKLSEVNKQLSEDPIDSITFEKCRLSLKSPTTPIAKETNDKIPTEDIINNNNDKTDNSNVEIEDNENAQNVEAAIESVANKAEDNGIDSRKSSIEFAPDIVRGVTNYTEDELVAHKQKLEELQLKQKLMEEQNKKRKEMLSKALADRTKQTKEEVMKLEKIKKELHILDGQLSQDVALLRKKIDHACLNFAEAEKHYLKVEKDFLQAKINLQKEREKKELLTEHLCALITHNETRKARKLETLMQQLVDDKRTCDDINDDDDDDAPVIVDGVDERTGKMIEIDFDG